LPERATKIIDLAVACLNTSDMDAALHKVNSSDQAAYLELICERYDMPPLADIMFDMTRPKFAQTVTWDEWKSEFDKGNNITA